jgi:hypothetical protein
MKKIITGLFFRLIKGFEIWVLLSLMLIASVYINYQLIEYELGFFSESAFVNPEDRDYYRFSDLGVSAHDTYWYCFEPVPNESYDRLSIPNTCAPIEPGVFVMVLSLNIIVPSVLMMVFIPVFFGRMFTDRTVKNYISCGLSKGMIYIASVIFACIVDTILYFTGLFAFALVCILAGWMPPIYLPVALSVILAMLLIMFTMSSVCLAALFISYSEHLSLVTGFLMLILIFIPVSADSYFKVNESYGYDFDSQDEYILIVKEKGGNVFSSKLDPTELIIRTYYGDKDLKIYGESSLTPGERASALAVVYADPFIAEYIINSNTLPACLLLRDGFMAIKAASNVFWILFFAYTGITFFKKRELPS